MLSMASKGFRGMLLSSPLACSASTTYIHMCASQAQHVSLAAGSSELIVHTCVWEDATSVASLWSHASTCTLSRRCGCLILQNVHRQIAGLSNFYNKALKRDSCW